MYKAAFIDMDGTLLRKDHTVSAVTKKIIHQLIERGFLIVPVSARPLHGMLHITKTIFPNDTPIVSLNGSYIYHRDSIVHEVSVSLSDAAAVHASTIGQAVSAMYYSRMEWFAPTETDAIKKEQKITPIPITIQSFEETLTTWEKQKNGPNKILITGHEKLILSIETDLKEKYGNRLNIFKSQPKYLEVMNQYASKVQAIQMLMAHYGLQQHEVVAIGDNFNDQGMIEFAGAGIAMGNAPDEIKKVADFVTDTNNNDGVAKALQHFFS